MTATQEMIPMNDAALDAAEAAATILRERGIPASFEPFDGSIHIQDDGAWWHWGTVNETWNADLMRDPAVGDIFGVADTEVSSVSTDPQAIACAIIAALTTGAGVEIWES